METTTHIDIPPMLSQNLLTALCLAFGITFRLMASPNMVYDIMFKSLSLVLVLMGIVINSTKFSAQIKKWRTKRKRKGG